MEIKKLYTRAMRLFRLLKAFYNANRKETRAYMLISVVLAIVMWISWGSWFLAITGTLMGCWIGIMLTEFVSWNKHCVSWNKYYGSGVK